MEDKQNETPMKRSKIVIERVKLTPIRSVMQTPNRSHLKQRQSIKRPFFIDHPASKYLFSTCPSIPQFKKFINLLYQGLYYSVCSLKGPSQEHIRRKSVRLPESRESGLKFLMLDLDETLIHSVWGETKADVTIQHKLEVIKFNMRPYLLPFLEKMSQYYEIYVFTASTEDYARPIVDYLNSKRKTIQGLLTRENCLQTNSGFQIKDLRIIKNRSLSDIVIVDNLVHSFGLQIDNGIPILQFTDNKEDRELFGIQRLLMDLKNAKDVREWLSRRVALRRCLEVPEDDFLSIKALGKQGKSSKQVEL